MMKKWGLAEFVAAAALLLFLFAACQPQTVIVKQRGDSAPNIYDRSPSR